MFFNKVPIFFHPHPKAFSFRGKPLSQKMLTLNKLATEEGAVSLAWGLFTVGREQKGRPHPVSLTPDPSPEERGTGLTPTLSC